MSAKRGGASSRQYRGIDEVRAVDISHDGTWLLLAGPARAGGSFRLAVDEDLVDLVERARARRAGAEKSWRKPDAQESQTLPDDVFDPPLDELLDAGAETGREPPRFAERDVEPVPGDDAAGGLEPERPDDGDAGLRLHEGDPDLRPDDGDAGLRLHEGEAAGGADPLFAPGPSGSAEGEPVAADPGPRWRGVTPLPRREELDPEEERSGSALARGSPPAPAQPEPTPTPASSSRQAASPEVESKLSIKEIQTRLRRGHRVTAIAKDAGVPPEWVERFEAPIAWERADIASRARRATLRRTRKGSSGLRLGEAVEANLRRRRLSIPPEEFVEHWDAVKEARGGTWKVRFTFQSRGRSRTAQWRYDPASGSVESLNDLAKELGWAGATNRRA